jgi:pimeloyl-ACP methyl ester carboxylesterase
VLLLHGQPGSAADWEAVATELAVDHRVIVPDRLGYGRTGGRAGGFAANAVSLAKLLGDLEVQRAIVVGHSWAGGAALEIALDSPALVAALCLVSSVSPNAPPGRLDRLLARPLLGTVLAAATLGTAGQLLSRGPGRALAKWRHRGQPTEQLSDLARSWHRPSTWRSFAIEQRALVHELALLGPRLRSVDVPVIVMVGSADRLVPPATGRELATSLPAATLEVVPGAGHLLPQLQPAVVAAAVRRLSARSF